MAPVSTFFTVTVAEERTAPDWSMTVPDTTAEIWAVSAGIHNGKRSHLRLKAMIKLGCTSVNLLGKKSVRNNV